MGNSLHPLPEVVASWLHPNYTNPETQGSGLLAVCIVFTSVSISLVAARLYARFLITKAVGLDDLFCTISLTFGIALAVLIVIAKDEYGVGRHIWDIPVSWLAHNRLVTWASEWCYVLASSSIKISILLFYKRLSAPFPFAFRVATWIGIIYNAGYAMAFCLGLLLLCRPLDAYWNQFSPQWIKAGHEFHCGKEELSLPISGALSVIGDFYSTMLPLLLVRHLKLSVRKKLALYVLFGLGFLVVAAGIVRTILLNAVINRTWDVMWQLDTMWIWTVVELNLAIVASSAPALKCFFNHCLIQPTASLYKRARKSGGTVSGHDDEQQTEGVMLVYTGKRVCEQASAEDIGGAV